MFQREDFLIKTKNPQQQWRVIQTDPQVKKLTLQISRDRTGSNFSSLKQNQNALYNCAFSTRQENFKLDKGLSFNQAISQKINYNRVVSFHQNNSGRQFKHKNERYYYEKIKEIIQQQENSEEKKLIEESLHQIYAIMSQKQFIPDVTLLYQTKIGKKFRVAIDLDETLIHSETIQRNKAYDYTFNDFGVNFRPQYQEFLKELSSLVDLFLFTSASMRYAKPIVDLIDPNQEYFKDRYYKHHCVSLQNRRLIKHIGIFAEDFSKSFIIDNSPIYFMGQPLNGIPISPFLENKNDKELIKLLKFIKDKILTSEDVRNVIEKEFSYEKFKQFDDGIKAFNVIIQ